MQFCVSIPPRRGFVKADLNNFVRKHLAKLTNVSDKYVIKFMLFINCMGVMRHGRKLAVILALLLTLAPCELAEARRTDVNWGPLRFAVEGNGGFRVDREKGRLHLPDSVVTGLYAHLTTWDIPPAYENQETAQRLFDGLLDGEVVARPKELRAALEESELDPTLNAGLQIEFGSPKGASRPSEDQKKRRDYADMWLVPMDARAHAELRDLVEVTLAVYREKGCKHENFFPRSAELSNLVVAMSAQDASPKDLIGAQAVAISGPEDRATLDEPRAVEALAALLRGARRLERRVKTWRGPWTLRFAMPDGREIVVRFADRQEQKTAPVPEDILFLLGDALYALDRE